MFKWDPCGILCVILIYTCILYADYVVIVWMLFPTFGTTIWGIFHLTIFNVLLVITMSAHTRAMTTDPGIVPISSHRSNKLKAHGSSDEDSESEDDHMIRHHMGTRGSTTEWTMCTRCESLRPPRAHHCRVCKRCVRKMDHHCPWVNNCVGEFNQKYFLQFILYVGVTSMYALGVLILCWVFHDSKGTTGVYGPYGENAHHAKVLHSIFLAMESTLFGMFVMAVSCDQLSAIFNDETAVEQVQRRSRYGNSRRPRASRVALMRQVCGPGPKLLWLLPCSFASSKIKKKPRYIRSHQLAHYDV